MGRVAGVLGDPLGFPCTPPDAAGQDALHSAGVEGSEDAGARSKLPQPSQEEETLMCLLQHCICVCSPTGLQSFKHVILFFLGMGTMVDLLKHEGTTDRERDKLKMSVKTPASWNAHVRSTRPVMPSGPMALWILTRLKDRVTSATERKSGLTSSAAAVGALSVWAVLSASKRA